MTSDRPVFSKYHWARELQNTIAKKIVYKDKIQNIEYVCGIDVSYKNNIAYTAAINLSSNGEVIETVYTKCKVKYPYIPGLFMLRESIPILNTIKALKSRFDILLVDGHGVLHPRKCGLASFVGFIINKPTIGVAKNLFVGKITPQGFVKYKDEILGYRVRKRAGMDIFVSIGHNISLRTAVRIVIKLTKKGEHIPEPLRIADIQSKTIAKN